MLPKHGLALGWLDWLGMAWKWIRSPSLDPLAMVTANRSVMGFNLSFCFERVDILQTAMAQLLAWHSQGLLKVAAVKVYPASRVADAHQALESGTTVGKLVLDMRAGARAGAPAFRYEGAKVRKLFSGHGVHIGTVANFDAEESLWGVRYDDGDVEEYNEAELRVILLPTASPAGSGSRKKKISRGNAQIKKRPRVT